MVLSVERLAGPMFYRWACKCLMQSLYGGQLVDATVLAGVGQDEIERGSFDARID